MFAARYGFDELEAFCRAQQQIAIEISKILRDVERGLGFLVNTKKIPLACMTKVVASFISGNDARSDGTMNCGYCCRSTYGICGGCHQVYNTSALASM